MRPYEKIDTLFRRDDRFRLTDELHHPYVIGDIARWVVEEKLDGTNLRLIYDFREGTPTRDDQWDAIDLRGRSDAANLNHLLMEDVIARAPHPLEVWQALGEPADVVALYGEGVGPTVAGGGPKNPYGLDTHDFVCFDIKVGTGPFGWLFPLAVHSVCGELGISYAQPYAYIDGGPMFNHPDRTWLLQEVVDFTRNGFESQYMPGVQAEGIVAKPRAVLYDNRGKRVMVKLKTSDFAHPEDANPHRDRTVA